MTLAHNRKSFRLAIFNFNQIAYPKNKLEWVIYDTSNKENLVEDLLPGENDREKYNIRYFKNDVVETIGESRNFAMRQCKNDFIVFFDDDDYYPAESVRNRITPLVNDNSINFVACSALGTFAINNLDHTLITPFYNFTHKRYRIATLAMKANYW